MEQDNFSQNLQTPKTKETIVKNSLFVCLLYFFTFIGSGIFNQIFVTVAVRIIIFLISYMLLGGAVAILPFLFERFKANTRGVEIKERKADIKKLFIRVITYVLLAGLLCFLVIILPYICNFPQIAKNLISQIFIYAVFVFLVIFFCKAENRKLLSLGFQGKNLVFQLLIGAGVGILTCFIFVFLPIICKIVPAENWIIKPKDGYQTAYSVLSNLLLIGVVEEFIFRGYIQTSINDNTKRKLVGVLIAAATFGVWHIFNGNIIQVCTAFLIGVIFGLARAYLKNCSLLSVMLAHGLHNTLIIVAAFIYL